MSVFLSIAALGFLLLLISAVGGDHGGDHDVSVDAHDVAFGDHPSPFSLRIISLFLTTFGAIGALSRLAGWGYLVSSAMGTGAGFGVGFAGYKIISFFMRQQASSAVESEDLVGVVGQVSVAIPANGVGQVSVTVRDKRMYPSARASDAGGAFAEGERVRVVSSSGNAVYVEKLQP